MPMSPESSTLLQKLTMAAKAIIYEPARLRQLLSMMNSPNGVMQAIKTVMGGIEQRTQIPPDVAPLLAVNIFMLMIDIAQEVSGQKPDPKFMQAVIGKLLGGGKRPMQPQAAPKPPQPAQSAGLLAQGGVA